MSDTSHPPKRKRRDPSAPPVPVEVSLRNSAAARISWVNTIDRRARGRNAAEGFLATFIAKVPAEITDPDERRTRGIELRRAYYLMLTAKAVKAARAKREARRKDMSDESRPAGGEPPSRAREQRLAEANRNDVAAADPTDNAARNDT